MRGAAMMLGGGGSHPRVSIDKAENDYMLTLQPAMDAMLDGFGGMMGGEFPDQERLQKLRADQERFRPKTFVFDDLEKAWAAVKEFLLDGRVPKGNTR